MLMFSSPHVNNMWLVMHCSHAASFATVLKLITCSVKVIAISTAATRTCFASGIWLSVVDNNMMKIMGEGASRVQLCQQPGMEHGRVPCLLANVWEFYLMGRLLPQKSHGGFFLGIS